MANKFHLGIISVDREFQVDGLPVDGRVPSWLSGTLLFNGPGKFEVADQEVGHWFDGLAMLRRFTFTNGNVSYANRFLVSRGYKAAINSGRIQFEQFGTDTKPSFFQRLSLLFSQSQFPANSNINVIQHGNRFLALTETLMANEFHPVELTTLGEYTFNDRVPTTVTTAHPHYDFDLNLTYNITQKFSLRSSYHIYYVKPGNNSRGLLGSCPVSKPSYMHSFAMTKNYVILTETPFKVNPFEFLFHRRPFIENYHWEPELGTRFLVFRKSDGELAGTYETEAFFTFHHINAFEFGDDILIDISAYPDPSIIGKLYLDDMRQPDRRHIPVLEVRRYRLSTQSSQVRHNVVFNDAFELPGINYEGKNGKEYRFAYGLGVDEAEPSDFVNQLIKLDFETGGVSVWHEAGCYPGEPVFVAAPDTQGEDAGLILSVVLDTKEQTSFLLILDATTLEEIARAAVPHPIPFGFHGRFFPSVL